MLKEVSSSLPKLAESSVMMSRFVPCEHDVYIISSVTESLG